LSVTLPTYADILELSRDLRTYLEQARDKGIEGMPIIPNRKELQTITTNDVGSIENILPDLSKPLTTPTAPTLPQIRQDLGDCTRCPLHKTRQSIVFGKGPESASLAFIGEAPEQADDQAGEPFLGESGKLFDNMLLAMERYAYNLAGSNLNERRPFDDLIAERGHSRTRVYLAHVAMCRPPEDRKPDIEEIEQCSPFLFRQLEVLAGNKLKAIICLGLTAARTLIPNGPDGKRITRLSDIRGQWHEWRGIPVMPTWHPSYLLRDPTHKGEAWADLKAVVNRLVGK
jgi:DNA polymerase